MSLFWIQLRKELHEQWATRKTLVVLAVMLAFGFLSPIAAKLLPELVSSLGTGQNVTIILPTPTAKDALDQYVKNTNQMILLVALVVSFAVIVSERERGLMTLIFPHALPRSTFVLAKFAALALLIGVGMVLEAAAAYLYTVLLFSAPDFMTFASMVVLLYLYVMVFVALAILASTLGRTTMTAAAIAIGFIVLVMIAGLFTDLTPNTLGSWAAALTAETPVSAHWGAVVVSLIVMGLAITASCIILNRQEIMSASEA
jgi:ABC-2 type transport system permease protein